MHEAASRALFDEEVEKFRPELFEHRGWTLFSKVYPVIDVGFSASDGSRLRIRMTCNDWNDRPPSVEFLNWHGQLLSVIERDPAGVFNNSAHPATGKPFVCMRGVRE